MRPETLQQLNDIINTCAVKDTRRVLTDLLKKWVVLTEPRWDDYVFAAQSINPPGAVSDPERDMEDGALVFGPNKDAVIMGNGQVRHCTNLDSYLHPHVHWEAMDSNAGDIVWQLDYKVCNIGEALPTEWTSITEVSPADTVHAITYFPKMPLLTSKMSTIILWRLSRVGTDPADTYIGNVKLFSFDVHYQKDKLGSVAEVIHEYGT